MDLQNGFKFHGFQTLRPYQAISISDTVAQPTCYACNVPLQVFCVLKSNSKTIRLGSCPKCGYAGYMDKPTKDALTKLYYSSWRKDIPVKKLEYRLNPGSQRFVNVILNLPKADKTKTVCEIGCGSGAMMHFLKSAGFLNVIGVEASRSLSRLAEANGNTVVTGEFETLSLPKAHIMYSHHVLEHAFNPRLFLEHAAKHQQEGDYLVIATPNIFHEPAFNIVFYVPHLHSFSPSSLEHLISACGYKVTHCDESMGDIVIVAQKQPSTQKQKEISNIFNGAHELKHQFQTEKLMDGRNYLFCWKKILNATRDSAVTVEPFKQSRLKYFFEKIYSKIAKTKNNKTKERSFIMSKLEKKTEPIFEIQYENDIELVTR